MGTNMGDQSFALKQAHEQRQSQVVIVKPPKRKKYGENDLHTPVDFSFLKLLTLQDAEGENPRSPQLDGPRDPEEKFEGKCLRMNNNSLSVISSLASFAENLFENPFCLTWIDLSFNNLTEIDPVLLQFTDLKILYLHGNKIKSLREVDKLASLVGLYKLTLHGNPMEEEKDYRMYVTSILPRVKSISFSAVTKCQKATATSWRVINNPDRKKKKKKMGDD